MGDCFWIRFMMMKSLQNIGLVVLLLAEEETSKDKEKKKKQKTTCCAQSWLQSREKKCLPQSF